DLDLLLPELRERQVLHLEVVLLRLALRRLHGRARHFVLLKCAPFAAGTIPPAISGARRGITRGRGARAPFVSWDARGGSTTRTGESPASASSDASACGSKPANPRPRRSTSCASPWATTSATTTRPPGLTARTQRWSAAFGSAVCRSESERIRP